MIEDAKLIRPASFLHSALFRAAGTVLFLAKFPASDCAAQEAPDPANVPLKIPFAVSRRK